MTRLFEGTPFDIPPRCERCDELESECRCSPEDIAAEEAQRQREADRLPPEKQTAKIRTEKRKGGRIVTVIAGLTARANDLPALLTKLKNTTGAGGTIRKDPDLIEIQGDHRERIEAELKNIGFRTKS
jgi:translation initiation factor 1